MVCVVFSESEFYCILVSPVIVCRLKVQPKVLYLMDNNRYSFSKDVFVLECI